MSVFRFSLRWLLALVAFIAVGLASLRYASVLIKHRQTKIGDAPAVTFAGMACRVYDGAIG